MLGEQIRNLVGGVTGSRDRAERDRAEAALCESEQRYRILFASNPHPMWIFDVNTLGFLDVNDAAIRHYGYAREEFLGMTLKEIRPAEEIPVLLRDLAIHSGGSEPPAVFRHRKKDGTDIYVEISSFRCLREGREVGFVLAHDVTERKKVEKALQESERLYRTLVETAAEGVWSVDRQGRTTFVNARMSEMLGCSREEAAGRRLDEFLDAGGSAFVETLLSRPARSHCELKVLRCAGSEFWASVNWSPLLDEMGECAGLLGMFSDITERRLDQQQRLRSEAHARSLVENAPYGIYRATVDGRFVSVNPALVQMLGYESEAELMSVNIGRDVYCNSDDRRRLMDTVIRDGQLRGAIVSWKRKDGRQITVRHTARSVADGGDFEVITEDVTQQQELEAQLRQTQKLEAIGALTGGIAHDFNNVLMVISSYSEMMLERIGTESPLNRYAEQILSASNRAASLTRQLLAFSRKQVLSPVVMDLDAVIREMTHMLQRLIGEDLVLEVRPACSSWLIKADPSQIEQVVINLAVNARDAMMTGGRLILETSIADVDEDSAAKLPGFRAGQYVVLTVSDNGSGISPEVLPRIFDPFFTTKEPGRGTGLGLSSVYGIVKQSGGYITAESEAGQGATFRVYLPRTRERRMRDRVSAAPDSTQPVRATVLLVEDEDATREAIATYLAQNGFRIIAVSNAEEALRQCASEEVSGVDVLLTDVIMPGMSAAELVDKLRVSYSGVRVVFMSGYTDDVLVRRGVLQPHVTFVAKPFCLPDLVNKLQDMLQIPE